MSHNTFAQEVIKRYDSGFEVIESEEIFIADLANFDGVGQNEIVALILDKNSFTKFLVIFNRNSKSELGRIPVNMSTSTVLIGDFDGDNKDEILTLQESANNRLNGSLFFWENGEINKIPHKLKGVTGSVGDVDGDGKDELVVCSLPEGYTSPGGIGPIRIQVFSWQSQMFESISEIRLDPTYLKIETDDLNDDGKSEIIALLSGPRGIPPQRVPAGLRIYEYSANGSLEMIVSESVDEYDNLIRIWKQEINGQKYIIIPTQKSSIEEDLQFSAFRRDGTMLNVESIALRHKSILNSKEWISLPLKLVEEDIDQDGTKELLEVRNKKVEFSRMD